MFARNLHLRVNFITVLVTTVITLIAVYKQSTSVFYIIYLFWFDELIRTISDALVNKFSDQKSDNQTNNRFFFLFVYFVFIVVFFGLIMDWNNKTVMMKNFEILIFKNKWFTMSVLSFVAREFLIFYQSKYENYKNRTLLSNGIVTLHLSIILGVLLWYLITKKVNLPFADGNLTALITILPFIILKLLFEFSIIPSTTFNSNQNE